MSNESLLDYNVYHARDIGSLGANIGTEYHLNVLIVQYIDGCHPIFIKSISEKKLIKWFGQNYSMIFCSNL